MAGRGLQSYYCVLKSHSVISSTYQCSISKSLRKPLLVSPRVKTLVCEKKERGIVFLTTNNLTEGI